MKSKKYLGAALAILLFSACNNVNTVDNYVAGQIQDPYQLMEAKRAHYEKLDKIKAEQERQLQIQKEKEEQAKKEMELKKLKEEEEARLAKIKAEKEAERLRIKNMSPIEKLKLRSENAMKEIEAMNKIAKDARQEEIDNAKAEETVKATINK